MRCFKSVTLIYDFDQDDSMEGFIVDDDELFKSPVPRILRAQSSSPALLQKQVRSANVLYSCGVQICRKIYGIDCVTRALGMRAIHAT